MVLGGARESALLTGSQVMQIRGGGEEEGLRSPQKTADINGKTQSPLHDHAWKGSARILTEWRPPLGRLLLGSVGACSESWEAWGGRGLRHRLAHLLISR